MNKGGLVDNFARGLKSTDKIAIQNRILYQIHRDKNPFHQKILKYVSKFNFLNGIVEYNPIKSKRTEYSDVRNFLIEIGVVNLDYDTQIYSIPPEHIHLYAKASEKKSFYSPKQLKLRLSQKDVIGAAAELAVLKYEMDRLGPKYEKLVEHISVKNEATGYDIKSVTVTGKKTKPRYIEVKAVPKDSYRFYWTENEIRVAELLNTNYYLYLLPVESKMEFTINKMKTMSDPTKIIFEDTDTWDVKANVICCSLRV